MRRQAAGYPFHLVPLTPSILVTHVECRLPDLERYFLCSSYLPVGLRRLLDILSRSSAARRGKYQAT
jgi:hypothetical protein